MTDLFICGEENSLSASKVCESIKEFHKKDILPFYILPWHSFINRMGEDNSDQSISLWSMYSKEIIEKRLLFYSKNISLNNLNEEFIEKLTIYLNLDQSQISDISFRNYHKGITKLDMLNFLDFMALYINDVIDKYNPRNIYDLNNTGYLRKLILLITEKRSIKYRTIIHSLFSEYILKTDTLGEKIDKEYKSIDESSEFLLLARNKINDFIKQKSFSIEAEKQYIKKLEEPVFKEILKKFYGYTRFSLKTFLQRKKSNLKFPKRSSGFMKIINPSLSKGYLYNLNSILKYLKAKIGNENNLLLKDYFYFPLGYTIENISASSSGNILSDFEIINKIRVFMHPLSKILIKEHRAMINERAYSQKRFLKKLKYNSIFYLGEKVLSNKKLDSRDLILNSKGVIVYSGTTGLEALLLNKPVIIFGNPIYAKFIPKIIDPNKQNNLFKFFIKPEAYITPKNSIENYVAIVLKNGIKLNLAEMRNGFLSKTKIKELAEFLLNEK